MTKLIQAALLAVVAAAFHPTICASQTSGRTIVLTCQSVKGYTLTVGESPLYSVQYITPNGDNVDIILSISEQAPADLDLSKFPIVWEKTTTINLPHRFRKYGTIEEAIKTGPVVQMSTAEQVISVTSTAEATCYVVRMGTGEDITKPFHLTPNDTGTINLTALPDDMCGLVVVSQGRLVDFSVLKMPGRRNTSVIKPLLSFKDGIK